MPAKCCYCLSKGWMLAFTWQMGFLYWLKKFCSLTLLAATSARISVYAAPETDADLDNKQCSKCKSAKGIKSPFAALKIKTQVYIRLMSQKLMQIHINICWIIFFYNIHLISPFTLFPPQCWGTNPGFCVSRQVFHHWTTSPALTVSNAKQIRQ